MKLLFFGTFVMLLLFLAGCTQSPNSDLSTENKNIFKPGDISNLPAANVDILKPEDISPPNPKPNVEYIGKFVTRADDDIIEARFSLMDKSKDYVSADGIARVRIVNDKGETVYTNTINVKKDDFGLYTLSLTGENFMAYVYEIPLTQVKKSVSKSGTMYLKFTSDAANFEELDTSIWGLPVYTEEELALLNEEEFSKSAATVDEELSHGNFEVTVTKAGYFTPLITWGDSKEYFRIDMEVENIGNEKASFFPLSMVLLDDNGNQYEKEYGGTLETLVDIYPNVKKSGYILFEKIPETLQEIKLAFQLGYDRAYNPYYFEYTIYLT